MKNTVSIVMPAYNAQDYIEYSIESVLNQTYKNYELIVVNDGSTDNTKKIIEKFKNDIKIVSQANLGLRAARNEGIKKSTGIYVSFIDADDVWYPHKMEKQIELIDDNTSVLHASGNLINEFNDIIKKNIKGFRGDFSFSQLLEGNKVLISSVLVKRQHLFNVGLFDQTNRLPLEDYQLWLSLFASGYTFKYMDQILFEYRVHSKNMSQDQKLMLLGKIYALQSNYSNYNQLYNNEFFFAYKKSLSETYKQLLRHLLDQREYMAFVRYMMTYINAQYVKRFH
ncbi:MAG: glycosyltransferase family 2 protein [Desulfohalobiaceae bacterium]|nr:glycosyltransferase family 2 protein [Desulfohalobiaceae bacterium]